MGSEDVDSIVLCATFDRVDMSRDITHLKRVASKAGWTVGMTNGGHVYFLPPTGGGKIYTSSTPSDVKAIRNVKARLRRLGLSI